jgi:ATP-dependent RNA helicase DDX27
LGLLKLKEPISVDEIIARRKIASNRKRDADEMEDGGSSGQPEASVDESVLTDTEFGEHRGDVEEEEEDPLATSDEGGSDSQAEDSDPVDEDGDPPDDNSSFTEDSEDETQAEKDRKAAFFDANTSLSDTHTSFLTMNLSRPILKALASLGFHKPTPIQAAAIPVALIGKDIVGGAVTGSGKTAAFIVPMLERLLYRERGKKAAAVRCLILVPTRELAVQCFETGSKLATLTDIRFCLIVGMSLLQPF